MKKYILILLLMLIPSMCFGATITAAQNGNWSATATWTGGAVPGVSDDAVLGGFDITFDVGVAGLHIQVNSITDPGAAGDLEIDLSVLGDCAITCPGGITAGTAAIIDLNGAAPAATLTITSDITAGSGNFQYGLDFDTTGNLVVVGDITGGSSGTSHGINATAAGDITVTGNTAGGAGGIGINTQGTGTLTANGNVSGATSGTTGIGIRIALGGTCNINGNIVNGTAIGLDLNSYSGTCTVVGNITSSGAATAHEAIKVQSNSSGNLHITGDIVTGASICIEMDGSGTLTVIGDITGSSVNINVYGIDASSDSPTAIVHESGTVTGGTQTGAYGIRNGNQDLTVDNITAGTGVGSFAVLNEGTGTCTITGSIRHQNTGGKALAMSGAAFLVTPEDGVDTIQFGAAAEFLAGLSPDFPDVGNVLVGDTVNSIPGTYEPALVGDVLIDITYGEDGIEFTGLLSAGGGGYRSRYN